jgi:hypothetical protein
VVGDGSLQTYPERYRVKTGMVVLSKIISYVLIDH